MIEYSDIALGPDFAYRLARQRLLLTERGRTASWGGEGAAEREVVLPGCILKVRWTGNGGTGQLFYPLGRPMSTPLDLTDPERFASLIHNVDVSIRRGLPNFPTTGLALADMAALAEQAKGVQDLDAELQFDGPPFFWYPTERMRMHLAAQEGGDEHEALCKSFFAGEGLPLLSTDPDLDSLVRWNLQMDGWMMRDARREPVRREHQGLEWIEVETRTGVSGYARAVGELEGKVLGMGESFHVLKKDGRILALAAADAHGELQGVFIDPQARVGETGRQVGMMVAFLDEELRSTGPAAPGA